MNMGMGMGMNGLNMNGMNGMNMNGMSGMNFMNPNLNMMNGMNMFPPVNGNGAMNWNMNQNQNQHQHRQNVAGSDGYGRNFHNTNRPQRNSNVPQPQQQPPQQPTGMTGVPTGPKAQQNQSQPANFYPPTGPSANKFSNQQRHVGNEEDNAYVRQPVNPHRHVNRNRRARQADYREL